MNTMVSVQNERHQKGFVLGPCFVTCMQYSVRGVLSSLAIISLRERERERERERGVATLL